MNVLRIIVFIAFGFLSADILSADLRQDTNSFVGASIGDYTLTDQNGKRFNISEFKGKPFVLSFIYTNCTHTCSGISAALKRAFDKADADFGAKFKSLSIGFDVENDSPEALKKYGANFTDDFTKWRFAASDKETMDKLVNKVGFQYKKTPDGFDHINMVTIVDADGKIYKHVYGLDFREEELLTPMYALLKGEVKAETAGVGFIEKIKLFCYTYDPSTGAYKLNYVMVVMTAFIIIFQLSIAALIIYLFRWNNIKKREALKKTI